MKNKMMHFIKQEDGMETVEWLCILAVVAGLITVVSRVAGTLNKKASDAEGAIDAIGNFDTGGSSDTGGNSNSGIAGA